MASSVYLALGSGRETQRDSSVNAPTRPMNIVAISDTLQSSLDTLDPDELNNMMQDLPAITEQLKQLDVDSLNTVLQGLPTLMDNVNKLQQQVETITNTFSGISALFGK